MSERIEAYDLARSFAILFVFLGHIIVRTDIWPANVIFDSLSPGLTMSLLGFVSAALLATRTEETGLFLIKRATRIYIPLFVCLTVILVIQSILGTSKFDSVDTTLHYLGLSGFYALFPVSNDASIGQGLWFVTAILTVYILLPVLRRLFQHRRGQVHLLVIIALCLAAYRWMNAAGAWNVVMAFCIGTYLGVTGRLDSLRRRPTLLHAFLACCLLVLCGLASTLVAVIPHWIRGLLLPFYSVMFIPLFFFLARILPRALTRSATFFAALSYEFYILHFYFINNGFEELFGRRLGLALEIPISFVLTLALSYILYVVNSGIRRPVEAYLLGNNLPPSPSGFAARLRRFFVLPFQTGPRQG